jgi:hypothetical protein
MKARARDLAMFKQAVGNKLFGCTWRRNGRFSPEAVRRKYP